MLVEVEDTDDPLPQRRDLEQLAGELTRDDEEAPVAGESAWLGHRHPGYLKSLIVRQLCGSANRMVWYCSTITIAVRPSGV